MPFDREQRGGTKKIPLVNIVQDFVADRIAGLRDFDRALANQVERTARFAFSENYLARIFVEHADFRRDPLEDVDINSFK